jgi:ribosomal protein L34E
MKKVRQRPHRYRILRIPPAEHRVGVSTTQRASLETGRLLRLQDGSTYRPAVPGVLRCAACGGPITDAGHGSWTRCPHCNRSVTVPGHIVLTCDRCGNTQQVRPSELKTLRLCAECSKPLEGLEILLAPRRRRHRHHQRQVQRADIGSGYADAAGAALVIGLAIIIVLLSGTVL